VNTSKFCNQPVDKTKLQYLSDPVGRKRSNKRRKERVRKVKKSCWKKKLGEEAALECTFAKRLMAFGSKGEESWIVHRRE